MSCGADQSFRNSVIDQVHHLRHLVFKERLRWDVESVHDREIDAYDGLDPLFGVCFGTFDDVVGCWRLLPTTGRCLTKDVFRPLLHDALPPHDPDIWEATRFALSGSRGHGASLGSIRTETSMLVEGLLQTGLQMGLSQVVAISDLRFERILARTGLTTHRYGPPLVFGSCTAVAGWFPVTRENLSHVQRKVLADEDSRPRQAAAA